MKHCKLTAMIVALSGGLSWAVLAEPAESFDFINVYGNNMVLQRDVPIRIVGTATAGKSVKVVIAGEGGADKVETEATAGEDGVWRATLPAKAAGGPYSVTLSGADGKAAKSLTNVMMGDVWLCSGQSNMEMPVWNVRDKFYRENDGDKIAAKANDDQLRLCRLPESMAGSTEPQLWVTNMQYHVKANCSWADASRADVVGSFSATAYFFGLELRKRLGVPVGLICSARGATQISLWMSNGARREYVNDPSFRQTNTLYNTMVHPFTAFPIKGVVWYQGCSDAHQPVAYGKMLKRWLAGLREDWNQPDLPGVIVQLPGLIMNSNRSPRNPYTFEEFADRAYTRGSVGYAPMREVQAEMMDDRCGVVVTMDLGDPLDIHPHNKKDFAPRIAAEAMRVAYGSKEVTHGPIFNDVKFENGSAVVTFKDLGGGLATRDGKAPTECMIAGANKAFYPATAEIRDNTLVLSSPKVPDPKYVRYAWRDYAYNPNLTNVEGFSAYPFRTDGSGGFYEFFREGIPTAD